MEAEEVHIKRLDLYERTEEVQDIIDRMPVKFGYWSAAIVGLLVLLMLLFGFIIRYPDVVYGRITVNTVTAPIKLVANTPGKLMLNVDSSLQSVSEGDIIAYIENPATLQSMVTLKRILEGTDPSFHSPIETGRFPHKVDLGALSSRYYAFLNAVAEYNGFLYDRLYEKKVDGLSRLLRQQQKEISNIDSKIRNTGEYIKVNRGLYTRDSVLYADRVLAASDLDRSKLNSLSGVISMNSVYAEKVKSTKEQIQTQNQITETRILKEEKYKELRLNLLSAYNGLKEDINNWEQNYTIKAPFSGQVQFLKFWTSGQFVPAAEPLFTIIPEDQAPYGQVSIPAIGAGKIKKGQEVIIKLDNYPYSEYGTVTGNISNISKTAHTEKTQEGEVETYLATVVLNKGLTTNYGKKLVYMQESKGSAEIITNNRRLIQRFFDNLKYILNR